jgi:hypothetical protein
VQEIDVADVWISCKKLIAKLQNLFNHSVYNVHEDAVQVGSKTIWDVCNVGRELWNAKFCNAGSQRLEDAKKTKKKTVIESSAGHNAIKKVQYKECSPITSQ